MRFDVDTMKHLFGESFSNALRVRIADRRSDPLIDRLSWLEERVRGRRIVHVGCVDHLPLLAEKRARGEWLHDRLRRSAARCLGLDINREGIDYLRRELGIPDVVCADIQRGDIAELDEQEWDLVVVAELLEHTDNPVSFLKALRERCAGRVREVVLTVPNAHRLNAWRDSLSGRETINSDHRYWFTPFTLAKVLVQAGLEPGEFRFVEGRPRTPGKLGSLPRRLLLRRYPVLRDTLVMTAAARPGP